MHYYAAEVLSLPCIKVRSAKLAGLPLTALALLPPSSADGQYPVVLAACYDNKVHLHLETVALLLGTVHRCP